MSNIYDYPLSFSLVRNYVVFTFKRYYGEYIVIGKENIPENYPLIFAPNHINALMDAIAIHSIVPHKTSLIFLARADIFKNKTAAKFLKFTKIMPAFRMLDGMENLGKNNEIFEQCVGILHQNKALGIMPEGNQGEQQKLRPLVKGIFRIAFAAQQKYEENPKVKIIPVGIDYGDLKKFGKHIIINIGKPIEMSEYMKSFTLNPVTSTNDIRTKLNDDLNKLSLNLATKTHYDCFKAITEIANAAYVEKLRLPDTTFNRFKARQEIAKKLVLLEKNDIGKIEELEILCHEYEGLLNKLNLHTEVLDRKIKKTLAMVLEGIKLSVTLPFFVFGLLFNFIPFFLPVYIRKDILKTEYEGFFSSVQYGLGILTFPLFYLLQTILIGCLISIPWWLILLFFFSQYPFGKLAIKWSREAKKFLAKLRFKRLTQKKSSDLFQAQNVREQIIRMIS